MLLGFISIADAEEELELTGNGVDAGQRIVAEDGPIAGTLALARRASPGRNAAAAAAFAAMRIDVAITTLTTNAKIQQKQNTKEKKPMVSYLLERRCRPGRGG